MHGGLETWDGEKNAGGGRKIESMFLMKNHMADQKSKMKGHADKCFDAWQLNDIVRRLNFRNRKLYVSMQED